MNRRCRALFLNHTAMPGGGEIALVRLLKAVDRNALDPVVVLASDGPLLHSLQQARVETHIIPLNKDIVHFSKNRLISQAIMHPLAPVQLLAYANSISSFSRSHNISLLYANSLKSDIISGLVAMRSHIPLIWHVRDRIETDYLPATTVMLFRKLARHMPDSIIANSTATLRSLHLDPLSSSPSSHVIYDGIPGANLCNAPRAEHPPLVGIIGRITPWKGQHIFLRACAEIHKNRPDVRFVIVGSPLFGEFDYLKKLEELVNELGLNAFVCFTGFQEDIQPILANLSIFVHASIIPEPFGQVIVEAMAAGVPVVATGGGGVDEVVEDGYTGALVRPGDHHTLALKVKWLLDHPHHAELMARAALKSVNERYRIDLTARKVEAVCETLLHSKMQTGA